MALNDDILKQEIRARIDIIYYGNKVVRDVLKLLAAADKDLMAKIIDQVESKAPGYWTIARLQTLLTEVRKTTFSVYSQASEQVKAEMQDFVQFEHDRIVGNIDRLAPVIGFTGVTLSAAQLRAIISESPIAVGPEGKLLFEEIFQALAASKEKRIRQAIRLGMVEGEPIRDITKRIFGADGLISVDRRGTEAMVRTVVNHVSNETAQFTYEANDSVIDAVMWVSTLDNRTTLICISRDKKVYPLDSGPRPPAHVNCRSIIVPVIKSWKDLGINLKEAPEGTRASMNGKVPASMSYSEWLKSNPQYAEEVLGKTRAEAFMKGGVTVDEFVNDKGRVLTLDELRDKHIIE